MSDSSAFQHETVNCLLGPHCAAYTRPLAFTVTLIVIVIHQAPCTDSLFLFCIFSESVGAFSFQLRVLVNDTLVPTIAAISDSTMR